MRGIIAILLIAGCAGSGVVSGVQPANHEATVLEAKTQPLDLDHNGRFEWLSVKFELTVPRAGTYYLPATVMIPTKSGVVGDLVYPRNWDWGLQSVPEVYVRCDTTVCPCEVWLSGRYLGQAMADSAVVVSLPTGEEGHEASPYAKYAQFVVKIRRGDWKKFEWGGKGLGSGK